MIFKTYVQCDKGNIFLFYDFFRILNLKSTLIFLFEVSQRPEFLPLKNHDFGKSHEIKNVAFVTLNLN